MDGLDPAIESSAVHDYLFQDFRREVVKNVTPPFLVYPSGHATFGRALSSA